MPLLLQRSLRLGKALQIPAAATATGDNACFGLRPSGRACREAIRSALAEDWAKGQEQPQQNRNLHGRSCQLVPDFQSALYF